MARPARKDWRTFALDVRLLLLLTPMVPMDQRSLLGFGAHLSGPSRFCRGLAGFGPEAARLHHAAASGGQRHCVELVTFSLWSTGNGFGTVSDDP